MDEATKQRRLEALRFFAVAITVLNLLGHSVLGFEQSHLQCLAAVLAAVVTEVVLSRLKTPAAERSPSSGTASTKRPARSTLFLPPLITGLAVGMLTYANDRVAVVVFGAVIGIASKAVLRAPLEGQREWQHFMNPSNFGITMTLLCFPSVGVAMPYQFTENLPGILGYLLPAVIIALGSRLNYRKTDRLPLILAWLGGFVLQALVRAALTDARLSAALNTMTGAAFILFTFYMITDPQTSPEDKPGEVWYRRRQVWFGAGTAAVYGGLMALGVVYTLFFALTITCLIRGIWLWLRRWSTTRRVAVPAPALEYAEA